MLVTGDANFVGLGNLPTASEATIVPNVPDWLIYLAGAIALVWFTKKVSK